MYDSKEIRKVTQNLSLRLSPERKYSPKNIPSYSSKVNYSPLRCCINPCCSCCMGYHFCYCCDPCCCCHCCNIDCNNLDSSEKLYSPGKYDNINSSTMIGSTKYQTNQNPPLQQQNKYFTYEQNQFNDFLKKLMDVESQIEDAKINLATNPDFNCEDAFRIFEINDKGYLDENDIRCGLNLIGINPTNEEVRLLMKRFDLQKNGNINYADFFDIVVPFEKNFRTRVENREPNSCCPCRCPEVFNEKTVGELRDLFNLIINGEIDINNMRKSFGTLRINLRDIFGLLDQSKAGAISNQDFLKYLDDNGLMNNIKDADLLFIRLDKNRNGKIEFSEVEDEIQTVY